jgi:hypothetical protein
MHLMYFQKCTWCIFQKCIWCIFKMHLMYFQKCTWCIFKNALDVFCNLLYFCWVNKKCSRWHKFCLCLQKCLCSVSSKGVLFGSPSQTREAYIYVGAWSLEGIHSHPCTQGSRQDFFLAYRKHM